MLSQHHRRLIKAVLIIMLMVIPTDTLYANKTSNQVTKTVKLKHYSPSEVLRFAPNIAELRVALGVVQADPYDIDNSLILRGEESAVRKLELLLTEFDTLYKMELTIEEVWINVQAARKIGIQVPPPSALGGWRPIVLHDTDPTATRKLRDSLLDYKNDMKPQLSEYKWDDMPFMRKTEILHNNQRMGTLIDIDYTQKSLRSCHNPWDWLRILPHINQDKTISLDGTWADNRVDQKQPLKFTHRITSGESIIPGGFVRHPDEVVLLFLTLKILN